MFFVLPDDGDAEKTASDPQGVSDVKNSGAPSGDSDQPIDTSAADPLADDAAEEEPPRGKINVELDLDDAPFLQDEPKPEPEAPPPADTGDVKMPEPQGKQSLKEKLLARLQPLLANKKRLMLIGGAAALVLILLIAGFIFFSSSDEPTPPVVPEHKPAEAGKETPQEPVKIVVPSQPVTESSPPIAKYMLTFDSFWVPVRGTEGEQRFLVCQFTVPTDQAELAGEIQGKIVILRDAVYYYLRNKPFTLLADKSKSDELRDDIVRVLNDNLTLGKIEKVFFVDYYMAE